jgi:anti-anti-sigma factor
MVESELEPGADFSAELSRPDDGTAVVRVTGELDLLTAGELQAVLDTLADEQSDLVLDFGGLDFIDSTGVHLVLRTVQAWRTARREVTVRRASADVVRAFELVGLAHHLPFRD